MTKSDHSGCKKATIHWRVLVGESKCAQHHSFLIGCFSIAQITPRGKIGAELFLSNQAGIKKEPFQSRRYDEKEPSGYGGAGIEGAAS